MRLAISNIAWDPAEDEAVAALLRQHGVDAVDIAPPKYFPDLSLATPQDVARVRGWWADHGIELTGMQSLLFGTTGLNVFGDAHSQAKLLAHLERVFWLGAGLGATRLVFGSPKNRDRSGLTDERTQEVAVAFFTQASRLASDHGVLLCLEPNPTCYGANFMVDSRETAIVVRAVDQPALRMQFDTGALTINHEDALAVLDEHADLIGHIHASEPQLVPLGDGTTDHATIGHAIARSLPERVVSIEMVATKGEPHLQSVERALKVARQYYVPLDHSDRVS
jgi:sugar phosphate isomerase/epimerase